MYGAPVLCKALVASAQNTRLLHREQRRMAIKVARAYRTIFWEAAYMLINSTPWVYVACLLADTYD